MGCAISVPQVSEVVHQDYPRCWNDFEPDIKAAAASHSEQQKCSSAAAPLAQLSIGKPSEPEMDAREEKGEEQTEAGHGDSSALTHLVPDLKQAASNVQEPSNSASRYMCKLRTDRKVREVYRLGKTLGTGGFSVVRVAVDKQTRAEYACKIMSLPPVGQQVRENESTRDDILKEIDILCTLHHKNVIHLREYYEKEKVYLITEMLTGGELLEAVLSRGSFTEQEARCCFVQLLRGIQYLHSRGVVHRDLKLENLLLASTGDIRHIKIADFGLAKRVAPDAGLQTVCGTPQYVAPEVIMGLKGHQYGPGVDMWSAGVVLFILLGGYPPFWSESEPVMFDQIRKGAFTFNDPVWAFVTQEAKDLICSLLVTDPEHRLTATQALAHPWVSNLPLSGRPPRQPPLPAPTPLPSLPFSLRSDHAEGQERKPATPPSSPPRVQGGGVRGGGRARQQQVQPPEGGRAAALAFIRSLELPAVKLPGPSSPHPPPAAAAAAAAAAVTATPPAMSTQEPGPAASCTPAGLGAKAGASGRDGVSDSVTQAESTPSLPRAGGSKGAGASEAERVGDRGGAGAGGWTGMAQGVGSGKAEGKAKSVEAATAAPDHVLSTAVPPPVPHTPQPPCPPRSALSPQLPPAPPAPASPSPPPACRACDGGPANPAAVPIPLTSHAITLSSSLSPGGGSWEFGASPDSAYCRLPSVTVAAQQQGTLCGAARTCAVQDALASVEGMLARCSSGATSELTQEDVLLLLHTKASLLHQLTDKAVQADVHMS